MTTTNPAIAQYQMWRGLFGLTSVLAILDETDNRPFEVDNLIGTRREGINVPGIQSYEHAPRVFMGPADPECDNERVLYFGWRGWPFLRLRADGRFNFYGGSYRVRDEVANYSFLNFFRHAGRVQMYVNPILGPDRKFHLEHALLHEPYLQTPRGDCFYRAWWKLTEDPLARSGWRVVPADISDNEWKFPKNKTEVPALQKANFEESERLRAWRKRQIIRKQGLRSGSIRIGGEKVAIADAVETVGGLILPTRTI